MEIVQSVFHETVIHLGYDDKIQELIEEIVTNYILLLFVNKY